MDNRTILDFDLPNELIEAFSDYIGNDDVYRLAGTCRFFRTALNDYKANRLNKRAIINANIRANRCSIIEYLGPDEQMPDMHSRPIMANRIFRCQNLVIGVSWSKLWAWDRISGELKWEYTPPRICHRMDLPHISIIGSKIVCMNNNENTGYGGYLTYIMILDAETGVLLNQYAEKNDIDDFIVKKLTTVTNKYIIIKRINGLITCYDTDFNIVESYQPTEVDHTDDEYKISLATPRFIVDIDYFFITIINRFLGTVTTLCSIHDPCAAYIDQDRLICRFSCDGEKLPAIPFHIIDLITASVVYEYKNRLFGCGYDKEKSIISSIAMRGHDVFVIAYDDLYYVNTKTHTNIILQKLPDEINDASIEIYNNYLLVTLRDKKYTCSMWDIESMQKMLTKRKVYDKPSWNDGRLFITNNAHYVCADFNDKPLVNL